MICIFLFLSSMSVSFFKKSQNCFEFLLQFILFIFRSKALFKFKYLNQFSKPQDLKSPQKFYSSLS
jgi:hypothetical protein